MALQEGGTEMSVIDYELGWNDALKAAIKKFELQVWFQNRRPIGVCESLILKNDVHTGLPVKRESRK